jgi:hypothetical protein
MKADFRDKMQLCERGGEALELCKKLEKCTKTTKSNECRHRSISRSLN